MSQERVSSLPEKGADLQGGAGNFRGSVGNFRESLGNYWGTSGLPLKPTAREHFRGSCSGTFGGQANGVFGKPCLCPAKTRGFLTKTVRKYDELRVFALKPDENDEKMMKMAGVTRAKAWFTKGTICCSKCEDFPRARGSLSLPATRQICLQIFLRGIRPCPRDSFVTPPLSVQGRKKYTPPPWKPSFFSFSGSEASMVYTLLSGPMVYTLFPCYPRKMVYTTAFFAL